MVQCKDQDEVDYYWDRLLDGGEESQCGWLKDRFGLSWQVAPDRLFELQERPRPGPRRRGDQGHARHAQDRHRRARGCGPLTVSLSAGRLGHHGGENARWRRTRRSPAGCRQ